MSDLGCAMADLRRALQALEGRYMLIGGLAVVLRGFPRHTDDIDITVMGADVSAAELGRLLDAGGFEARIGDAVAFAEQNMVLLYRHIDTGIEIDVTLAWLPFEEEAIAHAQPIEVEGVELPVVRVEDLLVYKAVAFRELDQRDIRALVMLHRDEIDLERVVRIVGQFAEAVEDPDRVGELERLLDDAADRGA
jgi:predicted nucleotidyltransferase